MTPTSIGRLTLAQQTADARPPTPEQLKAAKDFEAIFIRQLLSSLEKSSGLSGGDQGGGALFRSMMVSALADTAAEGGGIGLRDLITRAMLPPTPQAQPAQPQPAAPEPAALEPDVPRAEASPPGPAAPALIASSRFGAPRPGAPRPAGPGGREAGPGGPAAAPQRLGVTSRVLTVARSSPMLSGVVAGNDAAAARPEGNR